MTVLPIVARELRVACRRRGTFWWRVVSAGAALAVFGLVFLEEGRASPRSIGKALFEVLSVCFLGLSLLVGVVYTADALSEERRDGTLGLLFLTDLRGYDVVLGKLVASSLGAVYGVFAMLPVLSIPVLMGGVDALELGRLVLVLLNTLFFSLAVGILASALVRHPLAAMGLTLLLVLGLNLAGPLLALYVAWESHGAFPAENLLVSSVGYACALVGEAAYKTQRIEFWTSLGFTQLLAWASLVYACVRTRHGWRESGAAAGVWQTAWQRWLRGGTVRARRIRDDLLEVSPCLWLAGRYAYKSRLVWLVLASTAFLWSLGAVKLGLGWVTEGISWLITALMLHVLLRWWLAAEAVQALGPDRRSGALELLLTTPLPVREIVRGRWLGLQRQFGLPVLVLVMLDIVAMGYSARYSGDPDARWWLWLMLVLSAVLVADMAALGFLGMWFGLALRQARWALLLACGLIFGVPWLLLLGLLLAIYFLRLNLPNAGLAHFLALYAFLNLGVSAWSAVWARRQLLLGLRTVAAGSRRSSPTQPVAAAKP